MSFLILMERKWVIATWQQQTKDVLHTKRPQENPHPQIPIQNPRSGYPGQEFLHKEIDFVPPAVVADFAKKTKDQLQLENHQAILDINGLYLEDHPI